MCLDWQIKDNCRRLMAGFANGTSFFDILMELKIALQGMAVYMGLKTSKEKLLQIEQNIFYTKHVFDCLFSL